MCGPRLNRVTDSQAMFNSRDNQTRITEYAISNDVAMQTAFMPGPAPYKVPAAVKA